MKKLQFALQACSDTRAASGRKKAYWEKQYNMHTSGVRNNSMHDYTLVKLVVTQQAEERMEL